MKKLFLVRHAKSNREILSIPDIDRPLNERGYHDAQLIAEHFSSKEKTPQLMVSSPACRAISTALIFSRLLNYSPAKIELKPKLYETNVEDYLDVISQTNPEISTLMLFGHNFTISEVAGKLLGKVFEEMPTCAVVGLKIESKSWEMHTRPDVSIHFYLSPKMLKIT